MTSHENQQYCKVNERYPDERFLSEVVVIDCDRPWDNGILVNEMLLFVAYFATKLQKSAKV